jgi:hypothetical protein
MKKKQRQQQLLLLQPQPLLRRNGRKKAQHCLEFHIVKDLVVVVETMD